MSNNPNSNQPAHLPVNKIGAQFKFWIAQNQQLRKEKQDLNAKIAELQAKLDDAKDGKKFNSMMGDVNVTVAHVDFKLF
jgi:uncharacterized protein YlxW (UPF0749 family)